MENILQIATVPVIVTAVYWTINLIKYIIKNSPNFLRIIPVISAVLGAVFGVIAFFAFPSILGGQELWTAIITGGASGLAATGTNQIFKQIAKGEKVEEGEENGKQ